MTVLGEVSSPALVVGVGRDSFAAVSVDHDSLPTIRFCGAGTQVVLALSPDGLALMRWACDLVDACVVSGAESGLLAVRANVPGFPVGMREEMRARREQLGLSASEVGYRAGITAAHMSNIENGNKNPSVRTVGMIAVALGVPMEDLLVPDRYGQAGLRQAGRWDDE
nr:hypothetical protein [Kibdelosporangium sp. MJ126-NF4]